MSKHKAKPMVIVPPEDGIERHGTHVRLNPSGHKELVVKTKGREEETLNELSEQLDELLEDIEFSMQPAISAEQPINQRTPELVGSSGDQIRNNDDTISTMNGSTKIEAGNLDALKTSRASTMRGNDIQNKYNSGYRGDNIDYSATHSESHKWTIQAIAESIE